MRAAAAAAARRPAAPRAAGVPSVDDMDRRRVPQLIALAEMYLHVADDAESSTSTAVSLAPDWASATLYACMALALDPDHVEARRIVALCYLNGGAELLFPFSPSSYGQTRTPDGYQARSPTRACALAAIHLLQRGSRATFLDLGSARVYASASMVLGRYKEAHDALAYTMQQGGAKRKAAPGTSASASLVSPHDMYTSQAYTQLARMAMKQAKYTDAAKYCEAARDLDPYNWSAWTMLCDMALAPPASEVWRLPKREAASRPMRQVTPRAAALRSGMTREAPRTLATRTNTDDARRRTVSKPAAPRSASAPATSPPLLDMTRDVAEAYRCVRRYEGQRALELLCGPVPSVRRRAYRIAGVHCLVGRALHDMTEYTDAEMHFRRARAMEPYLCMHMDIYSLVLFQLHREVALSALAQDLLAMDPRSAMAHIAAGNTWSLQHQHDAAYQCFRQATLVAPECAYAYTLAGYEALELEQPARAVRLFLCARRCDRRHWNALAGLGQVYLRQGYELRASEAYAQAFLINRHNAVLLDLLGWTLEQAGDADGALAVYQRAIDMQPKAAMTRLKKAQLLLATVRAADDLRLSPRECTQRRQAAHAELLRVCALVPSEPRVHLMLARSYMRMGGGHFAPSEDSTPPPSPLRLPHAYHAEITHHLATAVDLDPRCVRDVHAMGDMPKLVYQATGAMIAEDEEQDDVDGYIWEG